MTDPIKSLLLNGEEISTCVDINPTRGNGSYINLADNIGTL